MDIRLICMDLDGTALRADKRTFSPRLEAALEKLYHQLLRHMDDLKLAPALRTMIDSFMNQPDEKE